MAALERFNALTYHLRLNYLWRRAQQVRRYLGERMHVERQLAERAGSDAAAELAERLRGYAADSRWRVREAVAMALQRQGDADLPRLLTLVRDWAAEPWPPVPIETWAGMLFGLTSAR